MTVIPVTKDRTEGKLPVKVIQFPHGLGLPLPDYGTPLSAGLDLYAAVTQDVVIQSGEWQPIPAGIAIALPGGYEAQIRSRSGLSVKHGIVILNSPGTIDADYRGEIIGILINHGKGPFTVTRGMRFAQMVIAPVTPIFWDEQQTLDETNRGNGRFGSTGLS